MSKSARDIIRENMRPLLSKEENDLIEMMEQYAAQQVEAESKRWIMTEYKNLALNTDLKEVEKQLAEVTRQRDVANQFHEQSLQEIEIIRRNMRKFVAQRDEAVKLLGGNEHEYYKDFCRQLENEKKDELPR